MLKEYALDNLVKQALKKYSRMFAMQKLALHYEALRVTVTTDEKWLVFVLEQILSNALKYTVEGSISIYMEDDWLVIEDTGIGICSEDLPRIFEKGFTGIMEEVIRNLQASVFTYVSRYREAPLPDPSRI